MKLRFIFFILLTTVSCKDRHEKEYYDSGTLKWKAELRNGIFHGKFETYYATGIMESKGAWENGIGNGYIERYFPNGVLEEKSNWKDGLLNGLTETFDTNGNLKYRGIYRNGRKIGEHTILDRTGNWKERRLYDENGDIIYLATYGAAHEKIDEFVFPIIHFEIKPDSVSIRVTSKIDLPGTTSFSVGFRDEERFVKFAEPIGIDVDSAEVNIHIEDLDKFYYRFEYIRASGDSLHSFDIESKLLKKQDEPRRLKGFS